MYKTGSIAVTNNSAIITGSGTLWVDAGVLNPGDLIFCPDGTLQEVLSFQSNTQLTLAGDGHGNTVYLGATLAGQAYGIVPIGMLPSTLALRVKTTLIEAQAAIASAVLSTAAQGLTATQQTNARTNIMALGAGDVGKGLLVKSVAGGVAVVLTAAEAANQFIELTGALTASINLIVPTAARLFVIRNSTTGAYTVTVKTAAGTGVTALQGGRMFIECDGTNCVDAMSYMRQTGGSINATPIGGTAPAAVAATTLSATGALTTAGIKEDAAGNVNVGTTVVNGATPAANGITLQSVNSGSLASVLGIGHQSGTAASNGYIVFGYNGGLIGSITQSGTTAVAYNTTSDHRLKENVRPANAAKFMDIEFVDFEWVDGRHDCGVIAGQLQSVYPDLVLGAVDATEVRNIEVTPAVAAVSDKRLMAMPTDLTEEEVAAFKAVDANYEWVEITPAVPAVTEDQTFPVYQQVNYIGLIGRMGTRVQQLQRTVDAQAALLVAMEARLTALETA